jgi:hypothetical protein
MLGTRAVTTEQAIDQILLWLAALVERMANLLISCYIKVSTPENKSIVSNEQTC